jgi:hypothetical protein
MPRRLSLVLLSAMFVYGLSFPLAPPARAVGCDVNVCIGNCQKKCAQPGCVCPQKCMQIMEKRKQSGQCR